MSSRSTASNFSPEFPLPEYKKLALTKADTSVTEDEVNDAINTFLENNIDYQQTGKPAAQKDMLKVDSTQTTFSNGRKSMATTTVR